MAEIITKDRKEYNIWDKINGVWNRLNFLTSASSVDASDGKDLQTKVGAINGISSSSTATDENIAASIGYVNQELTELNTNLSEYPKQFYTKSQESVSVPSNNTSKLLDSVLLPKGKYLATVCLCYGIMNTAGKYLALILTDDDVAIENLNYSHIGTHAISGAQQGWVVHSLTGFYESDGTKTIYVHAQSESGASNGYLNFEVTQLTK